MNAGTRLASSKRSAHRQLRSMPRSVLSSLVTASVPKHRTRRSRSTLRRTRRRASRRAATMSSTRSRRGPLHTPSRTLRARPGRLCASVSRAPNANRRSAAQAWNTRGSKYSMPRTLTKGPARSSPRATCTKTWAVLVRGTRRLRAAPRCSQQSSASFGKLTHERARACVWL